MFQMYVTPQYVQKLMPHNFCCNFSPDTLSLTMWIEFPATTKLKATKRIKEMPASATCCKLKEERY